MSNQRFNKISASMLGFVLSLIATILLVASAYSSLTGQIKANETNIQELQKRLVKLESVIDSVNLSLSTMKVDIAVIKNDVRQIKKDVEFLKNK